ncbi:MAG: hypothetical protein FJ191_00750 [Gammaproteobacteria bacterium]|nr:hypothetical protein [Gammaproteobacteria bacterium]
MDASRMLEIAHRHVQAEAEGNLEATLATLVAEPEYTFYPAARRFRGMACARRFYSQFFAQVQPCIENYALLGEWAGGPGVIQEVTLWLREPVGGRREHRILAILTFDADGMTGERLYASDALLRFFAGPLWDELEEL